MKTYPANDLGLIEMIVDWIMTQVVRLYDLALITGKSRDKEVQEEDIIV